MEELVRGIVQFCGFDDDDDNEEFCEDSPKPDQQAATPSKLTGGGEKKRRRGGRKNRQRMNAMGRVDRCQFESGKRFDQRHCYTNNNINNAQQQQQQQKNKTPRLMKELHERERVRGMDRYEARQLLQDKLLFRGETNLCDIRLRRFCIVVVSREQFEVDELGMRIPSETISISMENGKISSILRLVPSFEEDPQESEKDSEKSVKYRMKTMFWNPTRLRDSNMMFKMWNHFLDRCLHSLLLVPLSQHSILLEFLRNINEIRSILNNRITASICLSRVITIDDFLISLQQLSEAYTNIETISHKRNQTTLSLGLELCVHFISSMKSIATISQNVPSRLLSTQSPFDEWKRAENGLLIGPPPGLSGQSVRINQEVMNDSSNYVVMNNTNNINNNNINTNGKSFYKFQTQYYTPETYYFNSPQKSSQFDLQMGDVSSFAFADYSRSLIVTGYNNSSIREFISVQLYQRILQWIDEIDFDNMSTMEELEESYTSFDYNREEADEDEETFSGFEHID